MQISEIIICHLEKSNLCEKFHGSLLSLCGNDKLIKIGIFVLKKNINLVAEQKKLVLSKVKQLKE